MKYKINILVIIMMCFMAHVAVAENDCDDDVGCSEEVMDIKEADVNILSFEEFNTMYESEEDYILVDVRSQPNYDFQHIKGAVSLYVQRSTAEQINKVLPDKDQKIVVYCSSHRCPMSQYAARFLMSIGYTNILEYKGGLQEWRKHGKPVGKKVMNDK